ncbi:hypothetical protein CPC08DRAFT_232377 [Agrocybe pediades]|nr:hypothetical protein CPC08DRAFT_232377 [Agrocybe pediades]
MHARLLSLLFFFYTNFIVTVFGFGCEATAVTPDIRSCPSKRNLPTPHLEVRFRGGSQTAIDGDPFEITPLIGNDPSITGTARVSSSTTSASSALATSFSDIDNAFEPASSTVVPLPSLTTGEDILTTGRNLTSFHATPSHTPATSAISAAFKTARLSSRPASQTNRISSSISAATILTNAQTAEADAPNFGNSTNPIPIQSASKLGAGARKVIIAWNWFIVVLPISTLCFIL